MVSLALLRHGQSQWNLENRFTGWVDVDLTPAGEAQARRAGELLGASGVVFDKMYASVLTRAIRTGNLALEQAKLNWLPVEKDWRLNERHYGGLTGGNKAEAAAKFGEDQVHVWRRSYDIAPPGGESLKDTLARALPYYMKLIQPDVLSGRTVLVAAHGNSLRALIMAIEGLTPEQILKRELETGVPVYYRIGPDSRPLSVEVLKA